MLFWVRVLSSEAYDGRLIRRVATEAVEFGRGSWLRKISMCCKEFGWQEIEMKVVRGLSNTEVKEMLESIAWRKTREEWGCEMEMKPKLTMLRRQRADRRMMIKLRGGTAAFQIETGRWRGVVREDRVCKECGKGEVEDVEHWLLRCEKWRTHRQPLMVMVQKHYEVDQVDLAAVILYLACRNYKVLAILYLLHVACEI